MMQHTIFKIKIIKLYFQIMYLCGCRCTCPHRPEEGIGVLEPSVTRGCMPHKLASLIAVCALKHWPTFPATSNYLKNTNWTPWFQRAKRLGQQSNWLFGWICPILFQLGSKQRKSGWSMPIAQQITWDAEAGKSHELRSSIPGCATQRDPVSK